MSLYELFFEIELSIIDRFKLSPFEVRREKATEVFLLIRRLNNYTAYQNKNIVHTPEGNKKVIRRQAGDNWF